MIHRSQSLVRRASRTIRAIALGLTLVLVSTITALAASPEPSLVGTGDPRAEGVAPSITGEPFLAAIVVLCLGIATVLVTIVAVRLTRRT